MKPRRRKGTVLLQTLVMSVILSMIAVSLMKWVLSRYMMAARNYRSTATIARAGGYSQQLFANWNFNSIPSGASTIISESDGTSYRVCVRNRGATEMEVTSDADNPLANCP